MGLTQEDVSLTMRAHAHSSPLPLFCIFSLLPFSVELECNFGNAAARILCPAV